MDSIYIHLTKVFMFKLTVIAFTVALSFSMQHVMAQPIPSAGTASGVQPRLPERPSDVVGQTAEQNSVASPASLSSLPNAAISVSAFRFTGNSVMSDIQLQALVADAIGQPLNLAGLDALASKISRVYRAAGYTVARAYIPTQKSADGTMQIAIIEGRFSELRIVPGNPLAEDLVRGIYDANACQGVDGCKGQLITDAAVDRTLLLLRDIPGIVVQGRLQAGKDVGTSDYVLDIKPTRTQVFSAGYDNYGSPSVGKNRLNYSANFNNLTGQGDQLSMDVASMGTKQLTGGVSYSVPVGYWGTRAGVGYAHSLSRLGGAFAALGATVVGDSVSVYGLHPVMRGSNQSVYARVSAEVGGGKMNLLGASYKSNATVLRAAINGDQLDDLGGYNAYGMTVAGGHYGDQFVVNANGDALNARFNKISYNVSRQQALVGGFTLYGSYYGQTTNMLIPAGEMIGLGGPNSVRAYAGGEGGNAVGGVGSLELRYTQQYEAAQAGRRASLLTYALFMDRGWSDTYRGNSSANSSARNLGGAGVGMTWTSPEFYVRSSLARHNKEGGNASQIVPNSGSQFWLQAGVNF
jgi:hemolysin activation/secretion protein